MFEKWDSSLVLKDTRDGGGASPISRKPGETVTESVKRTLRDEYGAEEVQCHRTATVFGSGAYDSTMHYGAYSMRCNGETTSGVWIYTVKSN